MPKIKIEPSMIQWIGYTVTWYALVKLLNYTTMAAQMLVAVGIASFWALTYTLYFTLECDKDE